MKRKELEKIAWLAKPTKNKNEIVIRAAVHDDTLIVDVSDEKPYVRICLTEKDYAVFVPERSTRIKERFAMEISAGWYQKKLECLGGKIARGYGRTRAKENIDKKSVDTIKQFTNIEHWYSFYGWRDAIERAEDRISSARYIKATEKKEKKRKEFMDARMKTVPRLPAGFRRWAIAQSTKHMIHHNPFHGQNETQAVCTACGSEFVLAKEDRHKHMRCPCCRKMATTKMRALNKNPERVDTTEVDVVLFQRTEEGFVERHFVSCQETGTKSEDHWVQEYARVFLIAGITYTYYNKWNPWTCETFWDDRNNYGMNGIQIKNGPVYEKNITKEMFTGTSYEHSGFEVAFAASCFDPVRYLLKYEKIPQLEYIVKMGLARLAAEIEVYDATVFMYGCNGHTGEMIDLKIGKQQWRKLQKVNGGRLAYIWMKYEVEKNLNLAPELVKWFEDQLIRPSDLKFIHDKKLSYEKIQNYLKKQMDLAGEDGRTIASTWEDYLGMCARAKIDTTKEIFLKPKNLRKAHDELVEMMGGIEIANRAAEIAQRFPKVEEICKSLKKKYEYTGKKFMIVTPEKIEDIIVEGQKLGHCLDRTDRYFDRIQKQESYVVFLRRVEDPEMPFYTLEIEPDGTARQKRTTGDRQDESYEECKAFIRRWQKVVKKRMSAEDKKLAKESARLREEEFKELREKKEKVWHGPLAGKLLADVLEADLMVAM